MIKRIIFLLLSATITLAPLINWSFAAAAAPKTINTLDYFVSKHLDKALYGSHNQNQVVAGNISYYVKWDPGAYEIHTWDDQYIYLREDHSWQYDKGYAFRSGRWMKRNMNIGEVITESDNLGYYFNYDTCTLTEVHSAPYTMTLEKRIAKYNLGGDLGKQDVIVLKYDYSTQNSQGNFERFYYSKEWGWVKWELYNGNKLIQTSTFNKISDQPTLPDKSGSCTRNGTTTAGADPVVYPLQVFRLLTGKVVRTADSTDLYYITQQAQRQYICNPVTLLSYGVGATDIVTVSREELGYYPALEVSCY